MLNVTMSIILCESCHKSRWWRSANYQGSVPLILTGIQLLSSPVIWISVYLLNVVKALLFHTEGFIKEVTTEFWDSFLDFYGIPLVLLLVLEANFFTASFSQKQDYFHIMVYIFFSRQVHKCKLYSQHTDLATTITLSKISSIPKYFGIMHLRRISFSLI